MFEYIDLWADLHELKLLGLSDEEIAGYLLFFEINYEEQYNNEYV